MNLSKARVDPATPDGALSDGLRNHRLNLQPCLEGKGLSWRVCREGELNPSTCLIFAMFRASRYAPTRSLVVVRDSH